MWAIDAEGNTTFVNSCMADMLAYSVEKTQGQHLFAFMDERGVELCERNLQRRWQGIIEQHHRGDAEHLCPMDEIKKTGKPVVVEHVHYDQAGDRRYFPVVQQQLLCLFQEALVNVEKHASAQAVDINLVWGEDDLSISLSDDGQGFDPQSVQSEGHFGLTIMHERVREINGQLTLTWCPGIGTHLVLWLPLDADSQAFSPNMAVEGVASVENTYR